MRVFNPDPKKDGWSAPCTVIEAVNDDMPFLVDMREPRDDVAQAGLTVSMLDAPGAPGHARRPRQAHRRRRGQARVADPSGRKVERQSDAEALKHMQAKVLARCLSRRARERRGLAGDAREDAADRR